MVSNFPMYTKPRIGSIQIFLLLVVSLLASVQAFSQDKCVSPERISALTNSIKQPESKELNEGLKTEILAMKTRLMSDTAKAYAEKTGSNPKKNKSSDKGAPAATPTPTDPTTRICQILNSSPWPGKSLVNVDAASAWITLVKSYLSTSQQRDLLPVISAGMTSGEIQKNDELASFVDRLRLRLGQPQLFGTQLSEQNGFLVLYPLQSEAEVDDVRKDFGMVPLKEQLAKIERFYRKLVIRSTDKVKRVAVAKQSSPNSSDQSPLVNADGEEEVVKVDTSIVTIDATVAGSTIPQLSKADFKIYEDGQEQEISAFNASEAPFDIVLLLDLSGSTSDKLGLIKKTTKHFIQVKRDADRVAIVTFNSTQTVVSPLESDKKILVDRISDIKGVGASNIWDSEYFAMQLLKKESPTDRRKAIVVMTDGVDNHLYFTGGGSNILFGDLLEEVRHSQISIFPIYLKPTFDIGGGIGLVNENARNTMQLLADESGGTFYTTENLDKLSQVYERVLEDVGRVYSIGYDPKNDKRDGTWRTIKVEIPNYPQLKVRARTGYYAK